MASGTFAPMTSLPTNKPTKKRTPAPMSEQGKLILRRQRKRLQTESEELRKAQREQVIAKLQNRTAPTVTTPRQYLVPTRRDSETLAFQKVVVPRVTAVLASERVKATISVKMNAKETSAWTDFANINVTMARGIEADPINAAAMLRGLIYHEGGHIRFSIPFDLLINRYNAEVGSNPALAPRHRLTYSDAHRLHRAWNIAEDQRMEYQVIEDSPRKAVYLHPMVLDHVLNQERVRRALKAKIDDGTASQDEIDKVGELTGLGYPWVVWRRYMPKDLRRTLRASYVRAHGETSTRNLERAITSYMRASTPVAMIDAIEALTACFEADKVKPMLDHNEQFFGGALPDERKNEDVPTPDMGDLINEVLEGLDGEDDEGSDEDGTTEPPEDMSWVPPTPTDFVIDGEEEPEPPKAPDTPENSTPPAPNNEDVERDWTGVPDEPEQKEEEEEEDDDDLLQTLEDLLQEAENKRNADPIIDSDVKSFNLAIGDGISGSLLEPYQSTGSPNGAVVAKAMNLATELEEAFHALTSEATPAWREQQTRGVVNVGRYLTRQHGDREFFRAWDDAADRVPGEGLAVSILLDYSGSMGGAVTELAIAGYGMKAACDRLNIPCTVILWDHDAKVLWDGETAAEAVPVIQAMGSTNPERALRDVVNHRYEKDAHVVLIMTDGQFSTADGYLNSFRTPGTTFIGAFYQHGTMATQHQLAEMARKGFDICHSIQELTGLVDLLQSALAEFVTED